MNDFLIELEGPLAWVRLNRQDKRNALSTAMWLRLPQIAAELAADERVRVAVIAGAGEEAFSAGADITEMRAKLHDPSAMAQMQAATQRGQQAWANLKIPTIAAIQGACTGGGCGLALCCDIRVASDDSFFAIPPANLGLIYSLADSHRLVCAVGVAFAKEMLFTGRRVEASEALRQGLVNRLVPAGQVEREARELALSICSVAQSSVRAAKDIVNQIAAGATHETAESIRLFNDSFASAEFREGAAAFAEKRKPRF